MVLLGEAEYDTTEMIEWVEKNTTWKYVLRTSPQIDVRTDQQEQPIRDYPLEKGKVLFLPQAGFTQTAALTLNMVGWWACRYAEPIFMVTILTTHIRLVVTLGDAFGLRLSFLTRKAAAFTFTKVIWLTLLVSVVC